VTGVQTCALPIFVGQLRPQLAERGLSDADFFVLSLLSVRPSMLAAEIGGHVAYTGVDIGPVTLRSLCDRGLLTQDDQAALSLSAAGRDAILHVLAVAKAVEADLIPRLSEIEVAMLRNLLKRLIGATDPGLPKLWTAT
jgi:3-hydroxy-9,10-secoandrosta-1,3,5(10)-triene-9,17-dione monooxygenase reductase component